MANGDESIEELRAEIDRVTAVTTVLNEALNEMVLFGRLNAIVNGFLAGVSFAVRARSHWRSPYPAALPRGSL